MDPLIESPNKGFKPGDPESRIALGRAALSPRRTIGRASGRVAAPPGVIAGAGISERTSGVVTDPGSDAPVFVDDGPIGEIVPGTREPFDWSEEQQEAFDEEHDVFGRPRAWLEENLPGHFLDQYGYPLPGPVEYQEMIDSVLAASDAGVPGARFIVNEWAEVGGPPSWQTYQELSGRDPEGWDLPDTHERIVESPPGGPGSTAESSPSFDSSGAVTGGLEDEEDSNGRWWFWPLAAGGVGVVLARILRRRRKKK